MENPYDNQNPPQGNPFPPPGNQFPPPGYPYPPQGPPPNYWQHNPFPPPPGPPPQTALDLGKVVAINFGIFLLYQTLLALAGDGFLVLDIFPLVAHWITMLILMIISFSRGKKMYGIGHLISLVTLIIIGFGSCFLISDMLGGLRL